MPDDLWDVDLSNVDDGLTGTCPIHDLPVVWTDRLRCDGCDEAFARHGVDDGPDYQCACGRWLPCRSCHPAA